MTIYYPWTISQSEKKEKWLCLDSSYQPVFPWDKWKDRIEIPFPCCPETLTTILCISLNPRPPPPPSYRCSIGGFWSHMCSPSNLACCYCHVPLLPSLSFCIPTPISLAFGSCHSQYSSTPTSRKHTPTHTHTHTFTHRLQPSIHSLLWVYAINRNYPPLPQSNDPKKKVLFCRG